LAEQDNVSKGALGQIAKQRLSILLREVTFQRGTIARTMAFAIDHADAATEVNDQ
jgi:U2-associated protein SR140